GFIGRRDKGRRNGGVLTPVGFFRDGLQRRRDKGRWSGREGALCLSWGRVRFDGINMFMGGQANRTGTSTRPPHPRHTAPCPYARELDYAGIISVYVRDSQMDGDKHTARADASLRLLYLR